MKNYTKLLLMVLMFFSAKAYSIPKLSSFSSATATIFIDFDGQTVNGSGWNGGNPFVCAPAQLTDAQMTEIFNRVSEDYRPFNINITTDSTKFLSAPLNRRIRIIVTPTSAWCPGVGGISYIGSFTWGDDTPAFVFSDRLANSPKYVGECVTHESGHTVGLAHQSTYNASCALTEQYALGTGSGETSWAPVMGNSYYRNMTGWNDGPTPYGCANTQDNLTIITSQNGFTYRPDDYTDRLDVTSYSIGSSSFSVDGIITTNDDKDAFKYVIPENSTIHIEATPFRLNSANAGANLDIKVEIYNAAGVLVNTYDPADKMSLVIDTTLNQGTYYFLLSGTGNANAVNYGSLGSYTITGFRGALPIHDISLAGNNDKNTHNFNWNIIADEPIRSQVMEISTDGTAFRPLSNVNAGSRTFTYIPYQGGTLYYRLKATSVIDQIAYSNIIALRSAGVPAKLYSVSTLIQTEITVNASENYEYLISDANGRMIRKGRGTTGTNRIDMANCSAGLYVIQLINNNHKQTERIIKQ
jgi:hypothetical protein